MITVDSKNGLLRMALVALIALALPGCFSRSDKKASCCGGTHQKTGVILANVLDQAFFDDCHIPGSIHAPMDQYDTLSDEWSKDTPVVVYCSNYMCTASSSAAKKLKKKGFENVMAYEEGIAGWFQAHEKDEESYPVEGPCTQAYLRAENAKPEGLVENEEVKSITSEELRALLLEKGILQK